MGRPLRRNPWFATAALAGVALLLSGSYCSWRGYPTLGGSGSSATQTTIGPVGAFASVYVAGTEFSDGSASITIDGVAAAESQLKVGQVATVGGSTSSSTTGTAATIAVATKLVGPVSAVDVAAGTVTVLGQTVTIAGDTSVGAGIAPTDVGGLALGTIVSADGYRTSTGLIASRFDVAPAGAAYRVAGPVASLDAGTLTFAIGGTTIDYGTASGGLPALADGDYVIVTGTVLPAAATLSATTITAATESAPGNSGKAGDVHGAVTRFGSATDFDVAGQTVSTSATTTFVDGTSGSLAPDVEVEVVGSYDSNGVLAATTVTIVPAAPVRIVGAVTALDTAGRTLTVAGVTIATTAATRWDDRSSAALRTFGFATLNVGDWVVARGVAGSSTRTSSARIVERWTPAAGAPVELQDVAANVASPVFTLVGITIAAGGATFSDASGQSLTAAQFYTQAAGRVVRAKGTLAATGSLVAATVALRD